MHVSGHCFRQRHTVSNNVSLSSGGRAKEGLDQQAASRASSRAAAAVNAAGATAAAAAAAQPAALPAAAAKPLRRSLTGPGINPRSPSGSQLQGLKRFHPQWPNVIGNITQDSA